MSNKIELPSKKKAKQPTVVTIYTFADRKTFSPKNNI